MSNKLGAHCDWLTLSFSADEDGNIAGLTPAELAQHIFNTLQAHGLPSIVFKRRSVPFRRYKHAYTIHRPVAGSDTEDDFIFVGTIAYSATHVFNNGNYNVGLSIELTSKGVSEEYGFNPQAFFNDLMAYKPRITRCDIAIDYPLGDIDYQWVKSAYKQGLFASGGARPLYSEIKPQRVGRDTNTPVKAGGYTIYIAKRGGAKHLRGYEKAYQLSGTEALENIPLSRWFRLELELKPAGVAEIPHDVLFDYDGVFAGQYPELYAVLPMPSSYLCPQLVDTQSETYPIKLLYQKPEQQVSIQHLIHHANRCYGGLINVLKNQVQLTEQEIIDLLENDSIPNRLKQPVTL